MIVDRLTRVLAFTVAILADAAKVGMDSHEAVRALENISAELDDLEDSERDEFFAVVERVAAEASSEQAFFIRDIPGSLGVEPSPGA